MEKIIVTVGTILAELSPENDGESLKTARNYRIIAGGAVTNTVMALKYLGADVKFVSAVSNDSLGQFLINEIKSTGIDTSYIKIIDHIPTSLSFASVDLKGGKDFIFYRSPLLNEITINDFPRKFSDYIFDFGEGAIREDGVRDIVFQAVNIAKKNNATIFYAVNLREKSWNKPKEEIVKIEQEAIALSDIVVLNSEELAYISGKLGKDAFDFIHKLGAKIIFMTSGGDDNTIPATTAK